MKQFMFAAALFITLGVTAQSYKPAVKLNTGKKYTVTTAVKGTMSQEVMGQSMEIPMEVSVTSLLEVKKAEAKQFQLSSTTTHVVMTMNAMGQELNFDSDKKEDMEGQLGSTAGASINKPTLFSVDNLGKLIEGSVVKSTNPEKEAGGSNPLMGMMNIDAISDGIPALNPFINNNEIKVGNNFTDSSTAADGKNKKSTTYTLVEIKDGQAKFAIDGTASETRETEVQGMQMHMVTSTKTTGDMWVNTVTGLITKSVLNAVLSGTVEVAGMSIPITGNTAVTTTITETENK